mmetsp:Transcript_15952/g.31270  ORF Transcript_15952/g.31270 Transcript_15952/m.31270 type:complete len:588 (+) Transcript_15952:46-1809(+)
MSDDKTNDKLLDIFGRFEELKRTVPPLTNDQKLNTITNEIKPKLEEQMKDFIQIIMVGDQSAGKTSLINKLLRHAKIGYQLPTAQGACTHTATKFLLGQRFPAGEPRFMIKKIETDEIMFYDSFEQTCNAIKTAPMGEFEVSIELHYSHDMTFIDLPGLNNKNFRMLDPLVQRYIDNPSAWVCWVSPAYTDPGIDFSFQLIEKHSPKQMFRVLTRIDARADKPEEQLQHLTKRLNDNPGLPFFVSNNLEAINDGNVDDFKGRSGFAGRSEGILVLMKKCVCDGMFEQRHGLFKAADHILQLVNGIFQRIDGDKDLTEGQLMDRVKRELKEGIKQLSPSDIPLALVLNTNQVEGIKGPFLPSVDELQGQLQNKQFSDQFRNEVERKTAEKWKSSANDHILAQFDRLWIKATDAIELILKSKTKYGKRAVDHVKSKLQGDVASRRRALDSSSFSSSSFVEQKLNAIARQPRPDVSYIKPLARAMLDFQNYYSEAALEHALTAKSFDLKRLVKEMEHYWPEHIKEVDKAFKDFMITMRGEIQFALLDHINKIPQQFIDPEPDALKQYRRYWFQYREKVEKLIVSMRTIPQ